MLTALMKPCDMGGELRVGVTRVPFGVLCSESTPLGAGAQNQPPWGSVLRIDPLGGWCSESTPLGAGAQNKPGLVLRINPGWCSESTPIQQ